MPNCSKCHTYNLLGVRDCKKCGGLVLSNEGGNCPRCRKEVGPFAKMCRHCGWDLSVEYGKSKWLIWVVLAVVVIGVVLSLNSLGFLV